VPVLLQGCAHNSHPCCLTAASPLLPPPLFYVP
jgi:hypothetical protein